MAQKMVIYILVCRKSWHLEGKILWGSYIIIASSPHKAIDLFAGRTGSSYNRAGMIYYDAPGERVVIKEEHYNGAQEMTLYEEYFFYREVWSDKRAFCWYSPFPLALEIHTALWAYSANPQGMLPIHLEHNSSLHSCPSPHNCSVPWHQSNWYQCSWEVWSDCQRLGRQQWN